MMYLLPLRIYVYPIIGKLKVINVNISRINVISMSGCKNNIYLEIYDLIVLNGKLYSIVSNDYEADYSVICITTRHVKKE